MLPSTKKPMVLIVGGLLFGDEGKGTTVEYLVKKFEAHLVVRYNGGPQAMHHVVFSDKSFHCFSQFGSGSFFPYCKTLLSKYMVISPHTLLREMEFIRNKGVIDIDQKMFIDNECVIVTPVHRLMNRILETLRDKNKYGTTGMGVGITIDDAYKMYGNTYPKGDIFYSLENSITCLKISDLKDENLLFKKLQNIMTEKIKFIREILNKYKKDPKSVYENQYLDEDGPKNDDYKTIIENANKLFLDFLLETTVDSLYEFYSNFAKNLGKNFVDSTKIISENLLNGHSIVMEGAQGALLDRIHGFFPHITRSICSSDNALDLLKNISPEIFQLIKIGVFRVFSSRHGNGPFVTHKPEWSKDIKEDHNSSSGWQGEFRIGAFDIVAARYGIEIFKPDYLSITCLDKLLLGSRENDDIKKFPMNMRYKIKEKNSDLEKLFVLNEKEGEFFIENIKKRKDEEAWGSLDLSNALKNVEQEIFDLDKLEGCEENHNLKIIVENECDKRFKNVEKSLIKKLGRYIEVIQTKLDVPIKILSFGATHSDKIYIDHY